MSDCIFCKIANGELPCDKVYEDDTILAFKDLYPKAPVHVLVIPKQHIVNFLDLNSEDQSHQDLMGYLTCKLPEIAKASDDMLPARSHIVTPHAELSNMFLIEGERGCHRSCTFCVMRRSTNGGMRLVTPERILSFVPEYACV